MINLCYGAVREFDACWEHNGVDLKYLELIALTLLNFTELRIPNSR
jgi:hypothetical protein